MMVNAIFRQFLAFLIALNLIGAGSLPAAALMAGSNIATQSARSDATHVAGSKSAQSNPCDSMPCNSVPCKGAMPDCAQMCFSLNAPLALENPACVPAAPPFSYAMTAWPAEVSPPGQSIKPDPFPPKRLILA